MDNYNNELAKHLLLSLLPYYYLPEYLKLLPNSEIKTELNKRCETKDSYFRNKNSRVWPKLQTAILGDIIQQSQDDITLYFSF